MAPGRDICITRVSLPRRLGRARRERQTVQQVLPREAPRVSRRKEGRKEGYARSRLAEHTNETLTHGVRERATLSLDTSGAKDFALIKRRPVVRARFIDRNFRVRLEPPLRGEQTSLDREEVTRDKERLPSRFVFERVFRFEILPVSEFTLVKAVRRRSKIENANANILRRRKRRSRCDEPLFEKSIIILKLSELMPILRIVAVEHLVNDVTVINE